MVVWQTRIKKSAPVINIAIPSDKNVRKKENELEKLEKWLKEELEKTWEVKTKIIPEIIGALGTMAKLEKWLQQIPEIILETFIQKSALLRTAKIVCKTLNPGL